MQEKDLSLRTEGLILGHFEKYPMMQIEDLFKFLHHSACGCDHLVSSKEKVLFYLQNEFEQMQGNLKDDIEQLDGDYSRVFLGIIKRGLNVQTFAHLFYLSAKVEKEGKTRLVEKLEVAKNLIERSALPFDMNEFLKAKQEWENHDFCAVRHSEVFRQNYAPCYRVIANQFVDCINLFIDIDKAVLKGEDSVLLKVKEKNLASVEKVISKVYGDNLGLKVEFLLEK